MRSVDVIVIGAGPAGTAAAITLARGGREVLLADRARFPRDKCCGDGLTALALRELEQLGLEIDRVASWVDVDEAVVRAPGGHTVTFPLPAGPGRYAAVARRQELDAALVDLARAAGVVLAEGATLVGAEARHDTIRVEFKGSETVEAPSVEAKWAIGADGMWSPLRRALGVAPADYLGEWHAFRQYLRTDTPESRRLWVMFEPDLLPGYAWSFPIAEGVVNFGFGIQRGGRHRVRDMKRLWPDLFARDHIRAVIGDNPEPEGPHKAWPIPARVGRVPLTAGRTLFVGDAAAATDPMTGEGIGQALETGRLAAESVLAGGDVTRTYARQVRRALLADDRMARALIRPLAHPRSADAAVRVAGLTPWTRRNFARWLFEDYPRAALVTPRRWRRGLLTGPGAFADR